VEKEPRVVNLPIRVLRIANASGHVELTKTVPCPTHVSVSLERCRHCGLLSGINRDRDGQEVGVACRPGVAARRTEDRSLWSRMTEQGAPVDPAHTPVSTVMSRDVTCVTCDFSLEAVAAVFLDAHIGAVPVVDVEGCPVGMLSKTDLVRERFGGVSAPARLEPDLAELTGEGSQIPRLMTPVVHTLREADSVTHAAALMLSQRLHHLPVVDGAGRVVGMFSTFDFARFIVYARPA